MNNLLTVKMIQQINGMYTLQVYRGVLMVKEIRNLEYKKAVERIEEIKGEKDAASP